MVHVKLHSGMGNQLFQYSFAFFAMKQLNTFSLVSIQRKSKFKLYYFRLTFPWNLLSYGTYIQRLNNYLLNKLTLRNEIFIQSVSDESFSTEIFKNKCTYDGYFQDKNIAESLRPILLKHFRVRNKFYTSFKKAYPFFGYEKVLVVHIRLGDYENLITEVNGKQIKWMLPVEWYLKIIKEEMGFHERILILSDDPKKAKALLKLEENNQVIYSHANEIVDFLSLVNANTCIISNSSFAWWGAFLNEVTGKKIIAPVNWVGYNAGFEYPKGIMTKYFTWV